MPEDGEDSLPRGGNGTHMEGYEEDEKEKEEQNAVEEEQNAVEEAPPPKRKQGSGRHPIFPELKRDENGVITCPLCHATFDKTRLALSHYRRVHKKALHPCESCPGEYNDLQELRNHVDLQHNDGQGQLVCQECGMRFHYASSIKKHVKRAHSSPLEVSLGKICGTIAFR